MRKVFIVSIFTVFFSVNLFSQVYVDGVNINDLDITFCTFTMASQKRAVLDYGQDIRFINRGNYITNEKGKPLKFNGKIDVTNYLVKNGWDLYQIVAGDSTYQRQFYFKKR